MSDINLSNIPAGISVHNYKIAVKGIKKKIVYHFSDVHLAEYDLFSDENEKETAIKKTHYWEEERLNFANAFSEHYTKEQLQSAHTLFLIFLLFQIKAMRWL